MSDMQSGNKFACPCGSDKTFDRCCLPYLTGSAKPKTIKQTMRARYTAYALGGYGDYLYWTWHPDYRQGLTPKSLAQKTLEWQSLWVGDSKQQGDRGAIEFKAIYRDDKDQLQCHHEISQFLRSKGIWYYTDGRVQVSPVSE